jgi:fructose-1,6-bisphosphatase/inositol monophosphatase family enzyme
VPIVTEAGGRITGIDGKAFRYGDNSYIASNGAVHAEVEELLRPANGGYPRERALAELESD